jgi:hypothetical protein
LLTTASSWVSLAMNTTSPFLSRMALLHWLLGLADAGMVGLGSNITAGGATTLSSHLTMSSLELLEGATITTGRHNTKKSEKKKHLRGLISKENGSWCWCWCCWKHLPRNCFINMSRCKETKALSINNVVTHLPTLAQLPKYEWYLLNCNKCFSGRDHSFACVEKAD